MRSLILGTMCIIHLSYLYHAAGSDFNREQFTISKAFGKTLRLKIPAASIAESPKWRAGENPPLAARAAMQLADAEVNKCEQASPGWSVNWTRRISGLLLIAAGDEQWIWVVQYYWLPRDSMPGGEMPYLSVAVSMNGKVVVPEPIKHQKVVLPGMD